MWFLCVCGNKLLSLQQNVIYEENVSYEEKEK